jgi:hypothetical protein
VNDPVDDTAIINPWFAACVVRKMRLQPCKLLVAKPERVSIESRRALIREISLCEMYLCLARTKEALVEHAL